MTMSERSDQQKKNSRRSFFMILAVLVMPMILAMIMYKTQWGVSGKGQAGGIILTPPKPIVELPVLQPDVIAALYKDNAPKRWRLLVPVTEDCDRACEDRLYVSRQVHVALNQQMRRVNRVLVLFSPLTSERKAYFDKEHPNTLHIQAEQASVEQYLAANNVESKPTHTIYLVDQEGWIMMAYPPEPSPSASEKNNTHNEAKPVELLGKKMLKDIKKLLKLSYE